jgi:endo-1,4-beta-xylanase
MGYATLTHPTFIYFLLFRVMRKAQFLQQLVLLTLSAIFIIFISLCLEKPKQQAMINIVFNQPENPDLVSHPPLRDLAQGAGMKIGTSVLITPLRQDAKYREVLAREFNIVTPENAMKFGQLSSERGQYNFADADEIVAFAQAHQMQVHGHTLVWYRNLPKWIKNRQWNREELINILQQHIYTVVGHYRGQITSWDVVNEAIDDKGQLRDSIWLKTIGSDYIEMAFRWAHETAPNARLFYNDYAGEELGNKSNAIYNLVKELRQRNVPIHGVGFQMHRSIKKPPNLEAVAANIERFRELGLEVRIAEMDVKTHNHNQPLTEKLAAQAKIYQDVARICLEAPNCTSFTTWGVADHFSWVPIFFKRPDAPLLFDQNYHPKPAYYALVEALRQTGWCIRRAVNCPDYNHQ